VIDHLTETYRCFDVATIHIYFNYKEHEEQITQKLVANLLKQLVLQRSQPSEFTSWLFKQTSGKVTPRLKDLLAALYAEMEQFSRVFVVIDALDECSEDDEDRGLDESRPGARSGLLDALRNAPQCAKWLVTSRSLPSIREEVNGSPLIDIAAAQEDVEAYVKRQLKSNKTLLNILKKQKYDSLRKDIVDTILDTSGGM
jgi:hypothetical protein